MSETPEDTTAGAVRAGGRRLPSGRHNLSQDEVLGSQRSRLIDAMAASCAEKGIAQTTIKDVVGRAGVSRATFYQLFDDKEDCFCAAVEMMIERTLEAVRAEVDIDRPWPEAVAEGIATLLQVFADEPRLTALGLIEAPAAGHRSYEAYRRGVDELAGYLNRRGDPNSSDVPESAARAAVGGGEALIVDALLNGRGARLPELVFDITYMALVPYLGQERALNEAEAARARHRQRVAELELSG